MNFPKNMICVPYHNILMLINQFMTDTLNTKTHSQDMPIEEKHNKFIAKGFLGHIFMVVMVLYLNLTTIEAKQTVIAESLATKNDKILVSLLQETHSYIEYERYISSITFQCKAILKNQLTKNTPEKIKITSLSLDYAQVMSLKRKENLLNYEPSQLQTIRQIDQVLDILNGQCLYYTTSTFIYEYCHKEHVRQFDTALTKAMNVKPEYEDISMGVYNPQQYKNKRQKKGIIQLTPEQRKVTLPSPSNFSKDYNFLFVQDIDNKYGSLELQESEDGNLLFSSAHLVLNDNYYKSKPFILRIICQQIESNRFPKQITNYALLVDPYTFAYTNKQGKCDKYVSHHLLPLQNTYLGDISSQPIRVYGRYLYGNVQRTCASKWAWQRSKDNRQFENNLEEGSLLLFELYNSKQSQTEFHYSTVKKVYSSSLIELDVPLGKSFKIFPNMSQYFNRSTIKSVRLVNNITKCELIFKKKLDLKQNINLTYINNGIVKLQRQGQIKNGDNIGCICKSIVQESSKIIDLDVTIINNIWLNYYQAFINSNTNIYSTSSYKGKQYLLRECQNYVCFPFSPKNHSKTEDDSTKKRFTDIKKLSNSNSYYHFNESKADNFYILSIQGNGIIKLITRSNDGLIYTYLITEGQIIKMIQFANGTKQIIKENKFYQNSTSPSNDIYRNYIYIKIGRLPNGSYYGGIWKLQDFVFFPRFTLFDEQLISLKRTSGHAYLRILNLDNLRNKQHLAVVAYLKKLQAHYSMKEKMKADPHASLFLNQSHQIHYSYVSGKYCDPPVNKFRKTTVSLKCGHPWFLITKLLEKTPCEYFIQMETTLLCRQGHKEVLESDENLFNRKGEDIVIGNGVFCHPAEGLLDEAPPYLYLQKSFQ